MTLLALRFSPIQRCSMQHAKCPREMFPEFNIDTSQRRPRRHLGFRAVQQVLDEHIPAWRRDNLYLRNVIDRPRPKLSRPCRAPRGTAG